MINADMKEYSYFQYGEENAYGEKVLSQEPVGTVLMSIYLTSQSIQDNINYKGSQYIGLTKKPIDDTYVIQYGDEKLKVLYVNSFGRFKQVFMASV